MIISKNLEIGDIVRVVYNKKYSFLGNVDVKVSGVTTEDDAETYMKKGSLYTTYFAPAGISVTQYITLMSSNSKVYICDQVKTSDPIEYEKDKIVIPSVIVDYDNSFKFLNSSHIDIGVKGISKYFKLAYEKGSYIEGLVKNIKEGLRNVVEVGDLPVRVSITTSNYLQKEEEYLSNEDKRVESYNLRQRALKLNRARDEEIRRSLNEKGETLNTEIENTSRERTSLETARTSLETAKIAYDNSINSTLNNASNITSLLSGLEDGSIIIGDANYTDLKDKIFTYIQNLQN